MVRRVSSVVLAFAILGVAACERPWDGGGTTQTVVAPRAVETTAYRTGSGVVLLVGDPSAKDETQTQVIGRYGGKISFNASGLTVPPKAVTEDVVFTFTLQSSPYLAAKLSATKVSDGTPVTTFGTPLTLKLNYSKTPTPIPDPQLLKVYWVDQGTILGVQKTTVDKKGQNVYASLTHFSEYSPGLDAAY